MISLLTFLGCPSGQPPIFVLNLCQGASSKQEEKGTETQVIRVNLDEPGIEKNIATCLNYFKGNFVLIKFIATTFKKYNKDVLTSDLKSIYIKFLTFFSLEDFALCLFYLLLLK